MCRLFGMASTDRPVAARFWLLDALDSLLAQSRRQPDGWGIGWFDEEGAPHVERDAIPAWQDADFSQLARTATSRRFLAHVRYASTGAVELANTHPFEQEGRLFAHNGVVGDLDVLRDELGDDARCVRGATDSEVTFALVTREVTRADGDIAAGLQRAGTWIAEHLPVYAWNVVLTTPDELHALRWPDVHELWWLDREAGGVHGDRQLVATGAHERLGVASPDLTDAPAVVVASERMDEHPGWAQLAPGELLSVAADGSTQVRTILPDAPARPLTLAQLDANSVASQAGAGAPAPPGPTRR